jgi:hypothetical protein
MRPLRLQVRARGTVEERRLELAPAALEVDPRIGGFRLRRGAWDRLDDRAHVYRRPARIVAADPLLRGASEVERLAVEVRMRAVSRMDDGMRAADALELRIVPRRTLCALVLAVADLDRRLLERLRRRCSVENELDHLPVALVEVVPVVEDVEEPVLQRQLPGVCRIGGHVRVDRRRASLGQSALPVQVVAAGLERVPGEVEVVGIEPATEALRRWPYLHEIGAPGAAKCDRRLAEQHVDVDRYVRQPLTAAPGVGDEPHDGCVALCERLLLGNVRVGEACAGEDGDRGCDQNGGPSHSGRVRRCLG